ncbi:hypothetical protein ACFC1R_21635 [Kitasatospora sp. NPDC056138]|uniref:hypothetical protein n=1 Tax=Kitasatospora sp. NPDC056138 TaxID=3345724 RepID=UPI0035DE51AE
MTVAVLGFQTARDRAAADRLAELNRLLADRFCADEAPPGLLDYRVLRSLDEPQRFCAYWLWRDWSWREQLFADPTPPLRSFTDSAPELWAHPPDIGAYTWDGPPPSHACERGGTVVLSAGEGPGRLLTEQDGERRYRWAVTTGTDGPGGAADRWTAL